VIVSENDFLKARLCSWFVCVDNSELRLLAWTTSRVYQWQPIGNVDFIGLTPLFSGTLNICRHIIVISTRKACKRCCTHFDILEAMNHSLKILRKGKWFMLLWLRWRLLLTASQHFSTNSCYKAQRDLQDYQG